MNWQAVYAFVLESGCFLSFFPDLVNLALSVVIYAEGVGCVVGVGSFARRKDDKLGFRLRLLLRWTAACLGLVLGVFAIWGISSLSEYLARMLAGFLLVLLVLTLLVSINYLIKDSVVFLAGLVRGPLRQSTYSSDIWKKKLGSLSAGAQATLIRRTMPESLDVSVGDFLRVLREVENEIKNEPALSAYWAKRYHIEQIIRQERNG